MGGIRLLSVGGSLATGLAVAAMLAPASALAATDPCDAPGTVVGTAGDDRLKGSRGDDALDGLGGDDVIRGHGGDDLLCGGDGADRLAGDQGDDVLDGGPGGDALRGGRGSDVLVDGPGTLSAAVDTGSRAEITAWLAAHDIASIDDAVAGLTDWRLDELPALLLDTNAVGDARDRLLRVMRTVLGAPDRGFYAEIWGYTRIELTPGGFFGGCNHVFLDPSAFAGLSDHDALGVVMHESFHSFDCVNSGPSGALDEGTAIWVFKSAFPQGLHPAETWAEATYGTKLYYRDIQGQPNYPLGAVGSEASQKLLDVYRMLSEGDPSHLPWNSQDRLVGCYEEYFEQLNRNVDFLTVWLPSVQAATEAMLADPECRPL